MYRKVTILAYVTVLEQDPVVDVTDLYVPQIFVDGQP